MRGKHKKFESDLYTKYDGPAKQAISEHLTLIGHDVTVPPENYGPDLFSTYVFRMMYHEVEVSQMWTQGQHPFPDASIPERKVRLLSKIDNYDLFFWMLRKDYGRAVVMPHTQLLDKWLVEVPNIKVEYGEYFYRIPKTFGKEFDLLCQ